MRRLRIATAALLGVVAAGTVGYVVLGFSFLDALYQTVTTVSTVGFREVRPLTPAGQLFTIALILAGVGTALYAFGQVLDTLVDGEFARSLDRRRLRRMRRTMHDHVVICGWGRVGRAVAEHLRATGTPFVVVDRDQERLADVAEPQVLGDVSDDAVLRAAGIDRAAALVAALDTDADNVYVVLSARALRPDLVIIARARAEESTAKLVRAGADRVVNPQLIGGRRMAAFALQPDVADFLDVVVHDATLDLRIEQVVVGEHSALVGTTATAFDLTARTGVVLLALRSAPGGGFARDAAGTVVQAGAVLIGVGTAEQFAALRSLATDPAAAR